jgi:hypothetical protein
VRLPPTHPPTHPMLRPSQHDVTWRDARWRACPEPCDVRACLRACLREQATKSATASNFAGAKAAAAVSSLAKLDASPFEVLASGTWCHAWVSAAWW